MKNLLNGTDIATIFLDNDLSIKRFTPQAVKIVNFIGGDVGRPLAHLSTNIRYGRLVEDAKEVLETLTAKDLQVLSNDDRWYSLRILPYRTADNVIDGVVITLVDITAMKQLDELLRRRQDELQEAREHAENILAAVREPILVLDQKQRVVSASHSFYDLFHIKAQNVVGRLLREVDRGQWDIPELQQLLENIFQNQRETATLRINRDFPNLGHRDFLLNARRITRADHDSSIILLTMEENAEAPSPEKPIDVIS
jgi:two-component system CheB/CheR fusion protein